MSFVDFLARVQDEMSGDGDDGPLGKSPPRMRGLSIGRVRNLVDPLNLGRVQVQVPSIDGLDLFPFARVIVPGGSLFSGIYWIPNVDDEVLVLFEGEDPDAAYILGGVWNATKLPPLPSPLPQIRAIRSPLGNQLVFTETPPTLTIQSGPTPPVTIPSPPSPAGPIQTITLNAEGIQIIGGPTITITCGDNVVTIGPEGVSIVTESSIDLAAGDSVLSMSDAGIVIQAATITMTADAEASLNAGAALSLTAGGAATVFAATAATITAGAAITVMAGAAATIAGGGTILLASPTGVLQSSPATFGIPTPIP